MHRLRPGNCSRRGAPVDNPKEIVRAGYDAIADRYGEWAASFESPVGAWLRKFVERVPAGSRVLELGCGGDNPSTRALAERYDYLGVDLSRAQLERARRASPEARFELADATQLELEPAAFDGVVSLFMLGHIPRGEQGPLLRRVAEWLRPGGTVLATMGTAHTRDALDADWLGAPMFFASFDEETNGQLLAGAGLRTVEARVVPFEEPGHGLVPFMWVLAEKSHSRHEAVTHT
ncbi:MAG: class I SAM-dependent methyltransferase [Gaiellaceae bacterium]